ncbi:MAG: PhoH family protein [Bacteroidales bacterium]|nr:PhoH family protein [Bacteroidales bacterium]
MIEKTVELDSINPVDFYGVNNSNIDQIKLFFPKLKIIARDNILKVMGESYELTIFEEKFDILKRYFVRYNSISPIVIKEILINTMPKGEEPNVQIDNETIVFGNNGKQIKARTENQKKLVEIQQKCDLVFAVGPAGSGKTYTAVAIAVNALRNKLVKKIILCRPAVEAEEKLGFLPGDMREKLNPYLQPLYDALQDMIHPKKLAEMFDENLIQIAPLAYMRGRTLDHAFVILDEAQNATLNQIKMFLTRMGENSKFMVTGDVTQIDLPDKRKSGLTRTIQLLNETEGIGVISFNERDILRHKLVKSIVNIFDNYQKNNNYE